MSIWLMILLWFVGVVPVSLHGFQQANPIALELEDVRYGDHELATLDVYLPETSGGPFATVLLVHGTGVSKEYFKGTSTIQDLVAQGYAAVSVNYRPPTLDNPVVPLYDVACALGWIYAHSDAYHFDTQNIIAFGHSRGASIVALLGVRDEVGLFMEGCDFTLPEKDWLRGVVAYGGSYGSPEGSFTDPLFVETLSQFLNLGTDQTRQLFDYLAGIPPSEWWYVDELPPLLKEYLRFFPITWLDGTEPPFLLLHGDRDETVSVSESTAFAEALRQAGVPVELLIVPDSHHRVDEAAIYTQLFSFLDSTIR